MISFLGLDNKQTNKEEEEEEEILLNFPHLRIPWHTTNKDTKKYPVQSAVQYCREKLYCTVMYLWLPRARRAADFVEGMKRLPGGIIIRSPM